MDGNVIEKGGHIDMITQAAQISILVKDLEEAKQDYTKKLGFIVRDEIEFSPGWKYLTVSPGSANETRLELVKADTPEQEEIIGRQAANQVLSMFLMRENVFFMKNGESVI